MVAVRDGRGQGKTGNPISAYRGYHKGNGRRVDVFPRRRRDARTNRAFVGWTGNTGSWQMGGNVRDRARVRAWNRVPNAGRIGSRRRARGNYAVVKRGI